jgi:ATP-dependent DNA helicase PIF1
MIRAFQDNAIDAEIVGGQHAGKRVFIPRIPMSPSDDISLPFKLKKKTISHPTEFCNDH